MSSSPSSGQSLLQRLSAKEWNVRLAANEELIVLFNEASEGNVGDFAKYVPYLKKIVVDPYPPVKEKAMDALLIFMSKFNYQTVVPYNFGGELAAILIDKCLSARDSIKTKTVEALLLLIESGYVDVVISELCRVATTHKVPKISSLCVFTLRESVIQFGLGPNGVPSDHILPILEACFDHPFKDMRTEAFALTVEIHRWLGPSLRPHIKGLRPTQQKELEAAFEMIPPDSRQSLTPPRVIRRTNATPMTSSSSSPSPASSSPIATPSPSLQSSTSSSSINSSPSVQASLAALKSNPKRRSLSIPKASQFHSPVQTPTGTSPSTPSHIPSPSHSNMTPPSGYTPISQIPIRRSLTNIQVGSNNSTPVQSPTSANSNRNSISLTSEEIANAFEQDSSDMHPNLADNDYGFEDQNLPPVDLLSNLSSEWYRTLTDSGGTWHARKAQVDQLLTMVPPGSPLKGNTHDYSKLVTSLTRDGESVDVLPHLSLEWYNSLSEPEGFNWHERKSHVDYFISLCPPGSPLKKGSSNNYSKLVSALCRLFADPNISVQQSALRAIETLALGLRSDFSPHAKRLAPFLLEKFKDKKTVLVESVHSLLDLFHQLQCFTIADVMEHVQTTLSSKNPQMRYECLLWLERVIPTTSRQALLQVAAPLCESLTKLLDDSVVAVRNAASRAFVWLGETLGEQAVKPFMDNLSRHHLSKLKEVKEISFLKKEPSRPNTASGSETSSSRPNTAGSEPPPRPSTGGAKPVPRPGPVRQQSSKSLLSAPSPQKAFATPLRQSSGGDYFDEGDSHVTSTSDDETVNESKYEDEANNSLNSLSDSPFNESNSIYQVLHSMKLEVQSFYSKVNSNMESFEKRLKEKDGKRKEEAQFIQEYDKELHLWNEELQNKNKVLTDELQQAKKESESVDARVAEYESRISEYESRISEYETRISEFDSMQSSSSDAEAQEKLALLDELEGVTMEKDEAVTKMEAAVLQMEEVVNEKEEISGRLEIVVLERDEAMARLEEERAKARAELDADHLSSLEDELLTFGIKELDRLEKDHQKILDAIAKARALKQS